MSIVRSDPNQSLRSVPERGFQSGFSNLCKLYQEILFPKDRNASSDHASYIRISSGRKVHAPAPSDENAQNFYPQKMFII
jgi:hypothetical protein